MTKAIVNMYTVNRPTWEGVKLAPGRWQVNLFIYETYGTVWERKELGSHELPAKRERDMRRAAEALRKLYELREAG